MLYRSILFAAALAGASPKPSATPPDLSGLDNIAIDWKYFPIVTELQKISGGMQAVILSVAVILLLIAIVMWMAGKSTSSQKMQSVTAAAMVVCLVGSALTGAAAGLIKWAAGKTVLTDASIVLVVDPPSSDLQI